MKLEDLPVFEIGDRVIYKYHNIDYYNVEGHNLMIGYNSNMNNKKGTVKSMTIKKNGAIYYSVDFDEKHANGWDCNGLCRYGHGYNVSPTCLGLIDGYEKIEPKIKWYKNGKLGENLITKFENFSRHI